MRVLCDEDVPNRFVGALGRVHNVEVATVEDKLGKGATDDEIREFAENNDCVVLTNDKEFLKTKDKDGHGLLYFSQDPMPRAQDMQLAIERIAMNVPDSELDNSCFFVPTDWLTY